MQIVEITTDHMLRELRVHGTTKFPFQYNYEDVLKYKIGKINWHWHNEFEILQVMRGTVCCLIGNMCIRLRQGEGIFINTGVIHSIEAEKEGIISNILFSSRIIASEKSILYEKYIKSFLVSNSSHCLLSPKIEWQSKSIMHLNCIFKMCRSKKNMNEMDIHIELCNIWKLLSENDDFLVKMDKSGISLRLEARLRLMIQYIEEHYADKLFLPEIAQAANISSTEACRCFRTGMQSSPLASLNQYRLFKAKELLETTEDSVTDIAISVGFDSCNYFDRIFKRTFGLTPREFRKTQNINN